MSTNNTQAVTDAAPLQGLAAYLRFAARGLEGFPSHTTLLAWATEVEAAQSRAQDAAPAGTGGEVGASNEALIASFLRHTTVFHQSDTPEWLYARDGDGNSASIRASEIVSAIRNIIKEFS